MCRLTLPDRFFQFLCQANNDADRRFKLVGNVCVKIGFQFSYLYQRFFILFLVCYIWL